jgi:hypothetical protein
MSDHVDGPRSIGDPTADLTDLFAFTSPENPVRTSSPHAFSRRPAKMRFSRM